LTDLPPFIVAPARSRRRQRIPDWIHDAAGVQYLSLPHYARRYRISRQAADKYARAHPLACTRHLNHTYIRPRAQGGALL